MTDICVVSPVYNSADSIQPLCERLVGALESQGIDFRIVLVDDGSRDSSWARIVDECDKDARIEGTRLSRNFGQHAAITAGLHQASEDDWVVVMDCDLQDPPEEIIRLYETALQGYDSVVARFSAPATPFLRTATSRVFWRLMSAMSGLDFAPQRGNFRIMSRRMVEAILQFDETFRLLEGLALLAGYRTAEIDVQRHERSDGRSAYTSRMRLRLAVQLVVSYSVRPLQILALVGLAIALTSVLAGVVVVINLTLGNVQVAGWASIVLSILFMTGTTVMSMGIVGLYVGQSYMETKKRPLYFVADSTSRR